MFLVGIPKRQSFKGEGFDVDLINSVSRTSWDPVKSSNHSILIYLGSWQIALNKPQIKLKEYSVWEVRWYYQFLEPDWSLEKAKKYAEKKEKGWRLGFIWFQVLPNGKDAAFNGKFYIWE